MAHCAGRPLPRYFSRRSVRAGQRAYGFPPPPCPQVFLPERIAKQYGFDVGTAQYLQAAALLALVRMVYGLVPAEARQYTLYLKVCASAAANLRAHAAMPSKLR